MYGRNDHPVYVNGIIDEILETVNTVNYYNLDSNLLTTEQVVESSSGRIFASISHRWEGLSGWFVL